MADDGKLWLSLFEGKGTNIRKGLYGSVLVRDYNYQETSLEDFNPFTKDKGLIKPGLFEKNNSGGRWHDLGMLSDDGPRFDPTFRTEDTTVWQSRKPQRRDVTQDFEEIHVICEESTPLVDYLRDDLPLKDMPQLGEKQYQVTRPQQIELVERQILAIGVDGTKNNPYFFARLYPRVSLTNIGTIQWNAKKTDEQDLRFGVYPDPFSGFSVRRFRDGAAWRQDGEFVDSDESDGGEARTNSKSRSAPKSSDSSNSS